MNLKKRTMRATFFFSIILISLFSCTKNEPEIGYFYSRIPTTQQRLWLKVNGEMRGELPYSPVELNCGNDSLTQFCIALQLRKGRNEIEIYDAVQNTVLSGKMRIKSNGLSASFSNSTLPIKTNIKSSQNCYVIEFDL